MIQKIKKYLSVALASSMLLAPSLAVVAVGTASADIATSICTGTNDATGSNVGASSTACGTSGTGDGSGGLGPLAAKIVNIFSIIVGIVAVVMIIYGGFRYITSGGDSGSVGNAKNTLIYAIVGLIIVALAQVIVHYVLNTATSAAGSNT